MIRRPPRSPLFPYTPRSRPWSARCYGVARQRDRSRPTSTGGPALTLLVTLTHTRGRAGARPLLARCYRAARQRDPSPPTSTGGPALAPLHSLTLAPHDHAVS